MDISIHRDVEILNGKATLLTVTKITGLQVIYIRGKPVEVESVMISDGWGCCPADCTRARKNPASESVASRAQETAEKAITGQEIISVNGSII